MIHFLHNQINTWCTQHPLRSEFFLQPTPLLVYKRTLVQSSLYFLWAVSNKVVVGFRIFMFFFGVLMQIIGCSADLKFFAWLLPKLYSTQFYSISAKIWVMDFFSTANLGLWICWACLSKRKSNNDSNMNRNAIRSPLFQDMRSTVIILQKSILRSKYVYSINLHFRG